MTEPSVDNLVEIRDFSGLLTNADPLDIPPGATREQINLTNHTPGELAVRLGMQEVSFEN